jgi:hypothetical protein
MRQISSLSDAPRQQFSYVIDNYEPVNVYLEFVALQYSWFMTITWGNFSLYNERVAVSPNLLRQFKNIIPFGIMITGENDIDPFAVDSWITKNKFYFLSQDDVESIESGLYVRT